MNRATTVSTAPARGKVRTRRLSRPRGTQPRHGSQAPPPAPHLRPHPAPPRGSATKARRRPASRRKYHPPTDDASAGGMAIREGTKSLNTVSASGILERRFDHANTHSTTRPTTRTHRVVSHSARHSHERPEAETRCAATINVPCLLLLSCDSSWLLFPATRTDVSHRPLRSADRRRPSTRHPSRAARGECDATRSTERAAIRAMAFVRASGQGGRCPPAEPSHSHSPRKPQNARTKVRTVSSHSLRIDLRPAAIRSTRYRTRITFGPPAARKPRLLFGGFPRDRGASFTLPAVGDQA